MTYSGKQPMSARDWIWKNGTRGIVDTEYMLAYLLEDYASYREQASAERIKELEAALVGSIAQIDEEQGVAVAAAERTAAVEQENTRLRRDAQAMADSHGENYNRAEAAESRCKGLEARLIFVEAEYTEYRNLGVDEYRIIESRCKELREALQALESAFMSHTQWNGEPPSEVVAARKALSGE